MPEPTPRAAVTSIAPPCPNPVDVPAAERYVVPATIALSEGQRLVAEAIRSGFFRPADAPEQTRVEPTVRVYVPLWRIDAEVQGFHVGLSHSTGADGKLNYVLPTGGARQKDEVFVLPARRFLPFDVAPKVAIEPADMAPLVTHAPLDGELIDADVPRADAEREATARLTKRVQPNSALYARYDARVRSSALCLYPIDLGRYRYRGEATARAVEDCWVAVSARTGRVVGAHHPSALRSVVGKMKRLFGGGR